MNTSVIRRHLICRLQDNTHALKIERERRRSGNGYAPYETVLRLRVARLRAAIDYLDSRLYTQLEARTRKVNS